MYVQKMDHYKINLQTFSASRSKVQPDMSQAAKMQIIPTPIRLGRTGYVAIYLVFVAVLARTLAMEGLRPQLSVFLAGELVFLLLYSAVIWVPNLPGWLLHLYFACQSVLILWLISRYTKFDFLILLYFLLSAQVSLVFGGRTRWIWVGIFVLFSGGSLIYFLGVARGLALSLTTIASEIVVPAYIVIYHENELARRQSQALLGELQEANQRLQSYASQAEGLAALQERNRLARQLHDTVSQLVFSISLTARSAQVLLANDPSRLPEQFERLQAMTSEALAQLRSLITKLRPPQDS
jgi:signal transduction histidine kinase